MHNDDEALPSICLAGHGQLVISKNAHNSWATWYIFIKGKILKFLFFFVIFFHVSDAMCLLRIKFIFHNIQW